jgi:hypothetical protein
MEWPICTFVGEEEVLAPWGHGFNKVGSVLGDLGLCIQVGDVG